MARVLEPEVMDGADEAAVYDELDRSWGDIVFQGFAESAARMGVVKGRVLDVGTGTGRIAIRLAKLNPELDIEAIDLSEGMLDLARQNARAAGVHNITFAIGDAKQLPYERSTFDLAICHQLLHHFADPAVPLREMDRVVKSSGALLVRDVRRLAKPLMEWALPLWTWGYSNRLRELTKASFRAGLSAREFADLARIAGIENAAIRRHWFTHQSICRTARPYAAPNESRWPRASWPVAVLRARFSHPQQPVL